MCYICYCSLILVNMFTLKHECAAHYEWNVGGTCEQNLDDPCLWHAENRGQDLY
jgi:hypothetical protein